MALAITDVEILRSREMPALYESGVRYSTESRRHAPEEWCDAAVVLRRGWGDCEDLAAWRVAELRLAGVAAVPLVTWQLRRAGGRLFHVRVRYPDGQHIEDPSARLGMR